MRNKHNEREVIRCGRCGHRLGVRFQMVFPSAWESPARCCQNCAPAVQAGFGGGAFTRTVVRCSDAFGRNAAVPATVPAR